MLRPAVFVKHAKPNRRARGISIIFEIWIVMAAKTKAVPDMVAICQAFGDPIRFSILRTLDREGPTACGAFGLELPPATLTHHFKGTSDLPQRFVASASHLP